MRRLRRFLGGGGGRLAVIYGRRRCGKSTLIQQVAAAGSSLYFLAEELRARAARAPFVGGRRVVLALWVKRPCATDGDVAVVTPDVVMEALR